VTLGFPLDFIASTRGFVYGEAGERVDGRARAQATMGGTGAPLGPAASSTSTRWPLASMAKGNDETEAPRWSDSTAANEIRAFRRSGKRCDAPQNVKRVAP
jgi:hypothetical protein